MARNNRTHIITEDQSAPDNASGVVHAFTPHQLTKDEFGRRLYKLLLEKGWSQAELARRAGLQRESISNYVRGRSFPSPTNLKPLAEALGVSAEALLPNTTERAIQSDEPSFEMKVSPANATRAWVRLNRLLTLETAVQIAALVQADATNGD